jgi:hypothetical protein
MLADRAISRIGGGALFFSALGDNPALPAERLSCGRPPDFCHCLEKFSIVLGSFGDRLTGCLHSVHHQNFQR